MKCVQVEVFDQIFVGSAELSECVIRVIGKLRPELQKEAPERA